jgi:hypothetical protein
MSLPSDVLKTLEQLKGKINPLEDIMGKSAARALAEYTRPTSAAQRALEEIENTRKLLGGPTALDAFRNPLATTTQFDSSRDIRAALGHSMYTDELTAVRDAIGASPAYSASNALRDMITMESPYVNELQKLQKTFQREFTSASALLAEQAELQHGLAKHYASRLKDIEGSTALAAAQSVRNLFSDSIAALQLDAQRPHVLMDAYLRATTWLDPLKDLQRVTSYTALEKYRTLVEATDPLQLYRDAMGAAAKNPFGDIASDSAGRALAELSRIAEEFKAYVLDDSDDVEVAANDIAPYGELARSQLTEVTLSPASIEALVSAFMVAYEKLPTVRDKKIFATYIYPVIIGLIFSCINPYSDFKVKQELESANHKTEKAVQQAARSSGAPPHVLASFRFVTAQSLTVRVNPRIKSPAIGTLRFSQPVEILKKDRDWTLVHYSDTENEIELQGWVLSRYLKRFK